MKRLVFCILAAFSLILVSNAQAADIQGTFLLVPQESDNVVQKVESTVSSMNMFVQSIARTKVSKAARASKKVSISLYGNKISIVADDNVLPATPIDGTTIHYHNRDGDTMGLRMYMHDNTLEQTFVNEKGSRTNFCELSPDGNRLEMHVIIKSDYFEEPMKYKLVYYKSPCYVLSR